MPFITYLFIFSSLSRKASRFAPLMRCLTVVIAALGRAFGIDGLEGCAVGSALHSEVHIGEGG